MFKDYLKLLKIRKKWEEKKLTVYVGSEKNGWWGKKINEKGEIDSS